MKRRFFNVHLSIIFNYLILALVGAAYLEAQIRRLPKPNKVRIVSIVMEPSPINQAPTVSAGSDQTITLPTTASLNGTASDDGLPGGGSLTQTWSKISGPGIATFADVKAKITTVSFSVAGTYVLRLTVSDGVLLRTDDVTIIVKAAAAAAFTAPILPQALVDTVYVRPTGQTISVGVGGNLQAALNNAQPGDVITLAAGATYTGPFTLPVKSGSSWIVVRSATADTSLPPAGTRVTPAARNLMPKIVGPAGSPALMTAPGAHHFRFIAVEFAPAAGTYNTGLVRLGTGAETTTSAFPHHIILDRCYIHGDSTTGGKRGVLLSGNSLAVIDSYLSDWKGEGQDTQAIAGWTGNGPWAIKNNYLEAAGENILIGGVDPAITNLIPSDIEIRDNRVSKPLKWNPNDLSYDRSSWTVKNLLELKNARRVLITQNTFEHCWVESQNGQAILFSTHNQDGNAPWSTVEDVTFTDNIINGAARGLTFSAYDFTFPSGSGRGKRVLIKNNFFVDIGNVRWGRGADGWLFLMLNGGEDVTIDHNTALHTGNTIVVDGQSFTRFVFTNNIVEHNQYGIKGAGVAAGNATLNQYFPGAVFRRNVVVGADSRLYPTNNYYPAALTNVGFMDYLKGDVRLQASSPHCGAATDGGDIGANVASLP